LYESNNAIKLSDQLEYMATKILFTLPSPNPYLACVLTNLNLKCRVVLIPSTANCMCILFNAQQNYYE